MQDENRKISLVFSPFGYSYAVPMSIAYLKSFLQSKDVAAKCYDLNIDFYEYFNLLDQSEDFERNNQRYIEKNSYLEITNWNVKENFYQNIMVKDEFLKMIDKFSDRLLEDNPKIIGFSIVNTNIWFTFEIAKVLKKKNSDVKIIFGGPDCTTCYNRSYFHHYEELINSGIVDYIVIGEGEQTTYELIDCIYKGTPSMEIKGALYKFGPYMHFAGHRDHIEDVDSIPFPDHSDFDISRYPKAALSLAFNRGCNFNCTFCDVKMLWGERSFRQRSAENIAQEIDQIATNYKNQEIPFLGFRGAYVNVNRDLMNDLANHLIERWPEDTPIRWDGWARVNNVLTKEACEKLKKSGCHTLVFGFESGSEKVLKDMNKSFSIDLAKEVFKNVHEAGINCSLFVIIGFPTESEEDFQKTLDFIEENAHNIDAAYCMCEFLLSHQMIHEPKKWNIKEPISDGYNWETVDGSNTLQIRKDRLKRFYELIEKLKKFQV